MNDDGHACCILGVCCPPGGPAQLESLTALVMRSRTHLSRDDARAAAQRVLTAHGHFREVALLIDHVDGDADA